MKRREFNKSLSAAIAVTVSPFSRARYASAATTGGGATPVFSYPNGFASAISSFHTANSGGFSGSNIQFGGSGHLAGAVYYSKQQPPTAFTTTFSFYVTGLGSSPISAGITFIIQNTVSPPANSAAVGLTYSGDANSCGYSGATNQWPPSDSIAIKFDAGPQLGQVWLNGVLPSTTGMYFNGGPTVYPGSSIGLFPFNDLTPYGLNFYSGNTFDVTIVYDGSLLTMVIEDTNTHAQARIVWPLNLANTTNANGNYLGFTGGKASGSSAWEITNWSLWSGYNTRLATPTMSPAPGQYSGTQTVTLSYPSGSTCYYTTNGLLPTSSSTKYTGPITVSGNEVIQAVAIQSGFTDSLVATGLYQINTSNVINFPSGFSAGNLIAVGYSYLSGSAYRVSDNTNNTAGAVWFGAPVTISSFSTTFTLQWTGNGQGMAFVLQNSTPAYASASKAAGWAGGALALGAPNNAIGYGGLNAYSEAAGQAFGLLSSVAIVFNQYAIGSDPMNGVGLYTDGADPYGSQIATGFNFASGHQFTVTLSYSGTTLALSMTDNSTGAKFTHNFTINIPSTVGANTAYVGFTGGTGGASSVQAVQSWTYATASGQAPPATPVPAPPTNLQVK